MFPRISRATHHRSFTARVLAPCVIVATGLLVGACDGSPGTPPEPGEDAGRPSLDASPSWDASTVVRETETGLDLPDAPAFPASLEALQGRDSLRLTVPAVPGAADYRVFEVRDGVSVRVSATGGEDVLGATIVCAGLRQHNQCDPAEERDWGGGQMDVPGCGRDLRAVPVSREVALELQLDGLSPGTHTLVVEAVDVQCPFVGVLGSESGGALDVPIDEHSIVETVIVDGEARQWPRFPESFPVRTASQIETEYGSLVLNGQRPAAAPTVGEGPLARLAQPAPPAVPNVLARAVIEVDLVGTGSLPPGFGPDDFFEDFDVPRRPAHVADDASLPGPIIAQNSQLYQDEQFNYYSFGSVHHDIFVERGALHMVLADWGQEIMSTNLMVPRRPFTIPDGDDEFLHVTFEVPVNATQRRYFWLMLCGPDEAGQAFGESGQLTQLLTPRPFFMEPGAGYNPSLAGWQCLQFVPRGGDYEQLDGSLVSGSGGVARPETDLRLIVNRPSPSGTNPVDDQDSVVNVSPIQRDGNQVDSGAWVRQWDSSGDVSGVILDDRMFVAQRTRFDIYVRRDRVIIYIEGEQRICNDLGDARLTMAETAVGLGHVLYHSDAEHFDLAREDWNRTGQYHYRENTPFVDARSFDSIGVRNSAALPAGFDEGRCFGRDGA